MVYILICFLLTVFDLEIRYPSENAQYNEGLLYLKVFVWNNNELPESTWVESYGKIPRISTDWPTYCRNFMHWGFSESYAPRDSQILWKVPIPLGNFHEFAQPVVVDGVVYYAANWSGLVMALNALTGELLWEFLVPSKPDAFLVLDDAVTVWQDRVLVNYEYGDTLYALNKETGSLIWKAPSPHSGCLTGTPAVWEDKVYVPETDPPHMVAYDVWTGTLLWASPCTIGVGIESCPALADGIVYIGTTGGQSSVHAFDATSGELLWTTEPIEGMFWDTSPLIVGDTLWIGGTLSLRRVANRLHAYDRRDGSLLWVSALDGGGDGTPVYWKGFVLSGCWSIHGIRGSDGSFLWTYPPREESAYIHGSCGVADEVVFFGTDYTRTLYAVDVNRGEEIWHYSFDGDNLQCSPSIVDGIVYFAGSDSFLYAFGSERVFTYGDTLLFQNPGTYTLVVWAENSSGERVSDTVNFSVVGIAEKEAYSKLSAPSLSQNYPNPMLNVTQIEYAIPAASWVSMKIYNVSGQLIKPLVDGLQEPGQYTVSWNGRAENGQRVPPGVYVYKLEVHTELRMKDYKETKKMVLMR
jgi:outer membrane protein assembly factor BamB